MRIAVMGAGSIGGNFGGMLSRGGNEVTLIARGQHLNAIASSGLKVVTDQEEFIVRCDATAHSTPGAQWKRCVECPGHCSAPSQCLERNSEGRCPEDRSMSGRNSYSGEATAHGSCTSPSRNPTPAGAPVVEWAAAVIAGSCVAPGRLLKPGVR